MDYSKFKLKTTLGKSDYIFCLDSEGNPFRIKADDLKTCLGISEIAAESISVQYSSNCKTWHTAYTKGDRYMRIKCGSGAWSDAICIKISAFDIWKESTESDGTVEEFLASLRGENGKDATGSTIKLEDLAGYKDFVAGIEGTIAKQYSAMSEQVTHKMAEIDKKVASFQETLTAAIDAAAGKRSVIQLSGLQNGKNIVFTAEHNYKKGTSQLYVNGNLLVVGKNYLESSENTITLLTSIPTEADILVFIAILA